MSAYRWRNGGEYSFRPPLPRPPVIPPDPRYHGYLNYNSYNHPIYSHATLHPQHHANLLVPQSPNIGFYSPRNSLYRTSQYNHLTVPSQSLTPLPVQFVHPASLQMGHASFIQFPVYLSAPSVGQISHRKPSTLNPTVQKQQNPISASKKEKSSEPKEALHNTVCTSAPPIAVNPPVKERIEWPKPDIELVVKDISNPLNETPDFASEAFPRKRKRNKKAKVKKESRPQRMHYYNKNMVRDPWLYLKPVVGIIIKKRVVDSMVENKKKYGGGVKVDFSEMSLADCLEMSYEETVNGCGTIVVD